MILKEITTFLWVPKSIVSPKTHAWVLRVGGSSSDEAMPSGPGVGGGQPEDEEVPVCPRASLCPSQFCLLPAQFLQPLWSLLQPTLTFPGLNTPWLLIPPGKCSDLLDPFTSCPWPCPCRAPPHTPFLLFFEGMQPPSSPSVRATSSMKPANLQAVPARGPPSPWHFLPPSLPRTQRSPPPKDFIRFIFVCLVAPGIWLAPN